MKGSPAKATVTSSWELLPLKELGDWSGGGTPSKSKLRYWEGGTIPWVSPKDMKTERINDSEDHITKEAVSESTTNFITAGSVLLVTRSGILRHTLPVAVNTVRVTVNQDLKALTPRSGISPEYVAWALRAFSQDILNTCSKQGTTVNSVETTKLLRFEIPVAPPEQQQILVAEIEKQFSRLDEAVANLKRVKANLKRYRAAVLKAAVEGKLTDEWRKQHPNVEPASKLLERILAERRAKWGGKGKYKEPAILETTVLPMLPKGWVWTNLDHLLREPLRNGHSAKASGSCHGLRAFTLSAVTQGDFSERNTKLTVAQANKVADLWAQPGDIYVERSNTPELVGLARLYKGPARFAFIPDLLIRVRIIAEVLAQFVEVCLLSEQVRRYFHSKAQGISGTMPKIDQSVIEKTPIPLPPVQEQEQILAEVDRRLSIINGLEATVEANLTRADRLRQSVLRKAFSGELSTGVQ